MQRDSSTASVINLQSRIERLWSTYTQLRDRAETSQNIADGIAAGRAWAQFLSEFTGPRSASMGGRK